MTTYPEFNQLEDPVIENFAIINDEGIVTNVIAVDTALYPDEDAVLAYVNRGKVANLISKVKKSGVHGGFRFNPASIGGRYIEEADAFVHPQPLAEHPSFVLDTSTYQWVAPIPKPNYIPDGIPFIDFDDEYTRTRFNNQWGWVWNEEKVAWEFGNFHGRHVLNAVKAAIVDSFVATIADVS